MSSETVIVWAGLKIKPESVEIFERRAAEVIEQTRREPKCLRYDLLRDTSDPTVFYFFEEYDDDDAYQAHRAMPYMPVFRDFRATVVDKYLGIRILRETGAR